MRWWMFTRLIVKITSRCRLSQIIARYLLNLYGAVFRDISIKPEEKERISWLRDWRSPRLRWETTADALQGESGATPSAWKMSAHRLQPRPRNSAQEDGQGGLTKTGLCPARSPARFPSWPPASLSQRYIMPFLLRNGNVTFQLSLLATMGLPFLNGCTFRLANNAVQTTSWVCIHFCCALLQQYHVLHAYRLLLTCLALAPFSFFLFMAAPVPYGSSRARGQTGAAPVAYTTAMAMPDP